MFKGRAAKILGLVVGALALVLLIAEAVVRVKYPDDGAPQALRLPHLQPSRFDEYIEIVRQNAPKREYRILVTGGSAAAGHGATSAAGTFPSQLQVILNERARGKPIKVFNGGVLGLDSPGELLFYLRFLHKLRPDMIIMFSGFNDLWDTVKRQTSPRPYDYVKDLGSHQFVHPLETRILFRHFLVSAAYDVHFALCGLSRLYKLGADELKQMDFLPMLNLAAFRYDDAARDVEQFVDVARCFQALGKHEGFDFVLVIQPMRSLTTLSQREVPISRWEAKVRMLYRQYLVPQLRTLSREEGMLVLDLNESLTDELIHRQMFLFMDFCHLNDGGYRLVAEKIAAFLGQRAHAKGPGQPRTKSCLQLPFVP